MPQTLRARRAKNIFSRRRLLKQVLCIFLAQAVLAGVCCAQDYPTRPIRLVVPFPPGGVADIIARPVADKLQALLGKPVVVENRGGVVGTLGAAYVAHSAPDGYTLLLGTSNEIAMVPTLYPALGYDSKTAFAPISTVATFPNVLVVGANASEKSLDDLVKMARAKPGTLTFASSGVGSSPQLAEEILQRQAHIKIVDVPYKGGGPAVDDVFAEHVSATFATLPSAIGLIKAGKLRALAVTGETRSAALPDVPTVTEEGIPGLVIVTWNGVLAPAGTPPDIVKRLNSALGRAVADPKLKQTFGALGAETELITPEQFQARIDKDFDYWSELIKQAGISAQ
jgi:tripartite-type tricarboxylate transporter receptor subunit TctC